MSERLQKVMAHDGVASRRKSEELISTGHVKVNGKVVNQLGVKVDPTDRIEVDGTPLKKERLVYFALYKPRGVISSVNDEKDRKTVLSFFKKVPERIYPVGRLDYDTSGLLILTNDGTLDFQLTHPKYEIKKTYLVKVIGKLNHEELKKIREGVLINRKYKSAPAEVEVIAKAGNSKNNSMLRLTIHEGKNHEVKEMLKAVGHPVEKLKREEFAGIGLENLQPGEFRQLRKREVRDLYDLTK